MDLTLFLGVIKAGLSLWSSKESNKYIDKITKIEKEYLDEMSKPEDDRSQLKLDELRLDARSVAANFIKYAGKK